LKLQKISKSKYFSLKLSNFKTNSHVKLKLNFVSMKMRTNFPKLIQNTFNFIANNPIIEKQVFKFYYIKISCFLREFWGRKALKLWIITNSLHVATHTALGKFLNIGQCLFVFVTCWIIFFIIFHAKIVSFLWIWVEILDFVIFKYFWNKTKFLINILIQKFPQKFQNWRRNHKK